MYTHSVLHHIHAQAGTLRSPSDGPMEVGLSAMHPVHGGRPQRTTSAAARISVDCARQFAGAQLSPSCPPWTRVPKRKPPTDEDSHGNSKFYRAVHNKHTEADSPISTGRQTIAHNSLRLHPTHSLLEQALLYEHRARS